MELKVWVEGIQRIVCGVSDSTTCQDVVYALAHATGKTGRFTLIERWRNNERLLAPHENPLKILMKWGEYSNDVQFILQRSALDTKSATQQPQQQQQQQQLQQQQQQQQQHQQQHTISSRASTSNTHTSQNRDVPPPCRPYGGVSTAEAAPRHSPQSHLKKSLTFSGGVHVDPGGGGAPYKIPHHHRHRAGEVGGASVLPSQPPGPPHPPGGRPPAPPPYEVVRGNPPPPPPPGGAGRPSQWPGSAPLQHSPGSAPPRPPPLQQGGSSPTRRPHYYPPPPQAGGSTNPPYSPPRAAPPSQLPQIYGGVPPKQGVLPPPYRHPPPAPGSSPVKPPAPLGGAPQHQGAPPTAPRRPSGTPAPPVIPASQSHATLSDVHTVLPSNQNTLPSQIATHNRKNNKVATSPTRHVSPTRHTSPSRRHTSSSSPTRHTSASPTRHASPTRGGLYGRTRTPTKGYDDEQLTRNASNRPIQQRQSQDRMEGEVLGKDDSSAITSNGNINANAHILKEGHEPNSKENTINNLRDYSLGSDSNNTHGYALHGEQNNNKENSIVVDGRYRDLIRLINLQRDKLNLQHVEMTKHEAEIVYLEGRTREDETRLNYVAQEIERHGELVQQLDQEVLALQELENEIETVREVEADIKAQLGSLEAKLRHSEAQLSHHNAKIRELEEDTSNEKARSNEESRQQEDAMVREIDKLKRSIAEATQQAEHATHTSQCLMQEMSDVEAVIVNKKKEVETLVVEMKDANLASLSMTHLPSASSTDDSHDTGMGRAGSSRRMVGSPRQLENAVPTSKNPHGVWV